MTLRHLTVVVRSVRESGCKVTPVRLGQHVRPTRKPPPKAN